MTATRYRMRRAASADLPVVMSLLDERTVWLRTRQTNQWSTREFAPVMEEAIDRGETWLLWEGDQAVATLTLTTIADFDFWSREERLTPAFYLSKLATRLDRKGRGLGELLIDWASMYAVNRGVLWLRWDVWRTNRHLQGYYRSLGADLVRIAEVPGRHSGALFQHCIAPKPDLDIDTAVTFAPVATLASRRLTSDSELFNDDPACNQPGHEEVRLVEGWVTNSLSQPPSSASTPRLPLAVTTKHRPVLFDSGDGWHLKGMFSQPVEDAWPAELAPSALRRGQVYQLRFSARGNAVDLCGDVDLT